MPKKEKEKNSKIASRPSDVPEPNSSETASTTPGTAALGSKSLSVRLQEGLADYGVVAAVTWLALFFLSWGLFYVFLKSGLDVVAMARRWGYDLSGASLEGTVVGVSYALSQLTKPLRIILFLVVTPLVAYLVTSKDDRPKID